MCHDQIRQARHRKSGEERECSIQPDRAQPCLVSWDTDDVNIYSHDQYFANSRLKLAKNLQNCMWDNVKAAGLVTSNDGRVKISEWKLCGAQVRLAKKISEIRKLSLSHFQLIIKLDQNIIIEGPRRSWKV